MRALVATFSLCLLPTPALAEFAQPPDGEVAMPYSNEPPHGHWSLRETRAGSLVRAHIGPALDLQRGDPGFQLALDVGRSAGFRAAGSFVALGSNGGAAIYSGELWLCPGELGPLRPIAAAGAGLRSTSRDDGEATDQERAGVAVLRGGVELVLPTRDVESRAALSLAGYLPAIVARTAEDPETSLLFTATLALGF